MKKHLPWLLASFLFGSLAAQNTVVWTDSLSVVATGHPITAPLVRLLPDGTPLVFWGTSGGGANTQIWCKRLENGVFSSPVEVVQSPYSPSLFGFGGYDVAIADNRVYVVYEQLQYGILMAVSNNGGLSFEASVVVQGAIPGAFATLASVAVDAGGNPVVSYIVDGSTASYAVRRSTDGGQSFEAPLTANAPAPGGAVCECCLSDLLCSGDSTWLVFRNNNNNQRDIWVSRSSSQSAAFDIAADVDATDWQLNSCPIAGPRMARSGDSLFTAWVSGAGGFGRVFLSTLHAGSMQAGQQFGFTTGSGTQVVQAQPDIVASGDTVALVFLEKGKEIAFAYSEQGAAGLNNPYVLFAVPGHVLKYPSLAFRQGSFYLAYVDVTADRVLYRRGVVQAASSAAQPGYAPDIKVFPNPSVRQQVHVRCDTDDILAVRLTDARGIVLLENVVQAASTTLPTAGLPAGIYLLHIETDRGTAQRTLVLY